MNVTVINIKDLTRYLIKIFLIIFILLFFCKILYKPSSINLKEFKLNIDTVNILKHELSIFGINDEVKIEKKNIINWQIAITPNTTQKNEKQGAVIGNVPQINTEENNGNEVMTAPEEVTIEKNSTTEKVSERNLAENYNLEYSNVKIRNKTDFILTSEILTPNIELEHPKSVLIYHTHTCESYTPSSLYNYTMTGNYRTNDSNFNMIRVGNELNKYLTQKGFNVIHDGTYHDYPSYSGSYDRSYITATDILYDNNIELVFDIHRDAVGEGTTYGPTVMIGDKRVAQIMFVIGTNGGGLEHPNWQENLKIAIKIQSKANELYPGLFRPIILTNSRYNQHIAKGACIIEVGATANTLEECLLSMQCLANVLEEL